MKLICATERTARNFPYSHTTGGIPIVPLAVKNKGLNEYNYAEGKSFLFNWDLEIEARNPDAAGVLVEFGIEPTTAAFLLASVIPGLIAIDFNPHASDNVLAATIADLIHRA